MRKRLIPTVLLSFLVLVTLFAAAQNTADPSSQCVGVGRMQGLAGEIQCVEDEIKRAPANQRPALLFWLAQTYDAVAGSKAEEYYRLFFAEHCNVSSEQCQRANRRLMEIQNARNAPRTIEMPFGPPFGFAISPDGTQLVYLATVDGKTGLWIRRLDNGKATPIPASDRLQFGLPGVNKPSPFWAPGGGALGFFADRKLWRVDADGANMKSLAEAPDNCGGAWGPEPDNVIVFAPTCGGGIDRISAGGGVPHQVTQGGHRYPQFLPDGRHFVFSDVNNGPGIGSLDSVKIRSIGVGGVGVRFVPPDQILFVDNEVLFVQRFDPKNMELTGDQLRLPYRVAALGGGAALSVSENGTIAYRSERIPRWRLVRLDRDGRRAGAVGQPDSSTGPPRISPDGKTAALFNRPNARLFNLASGDFRTVQFSIPAQLGPFPPVWAPDGNEILVGSARGGLYRKALSENAGVREVFKSADQSQNAPQDWSGKTDFILFTKREPTARGGGIFAVSAGGGSPLLVAEDASLGTGGQFSPNGRWVAYSIREEGRDEIYVQPFPGSKAARLKVSLSGGRYPQWSRDERELYFLSEDNHMMVSAVTMPATGGNIKTDTPRPLFPTPLADGATFALARDGRFLVHEPMEAAPPIYVLSSWPRVTEKSPAPPNPPIPIPGGARG